MNSTAMNIETGIEPVALQGVASGALWTLAASVSAALSQWLLLMMTAKLGSTEMVGQLALSLAVVAPIQVLTDMALRPALATDARHEFHFRDYFRLRVAMTTLAVIAVCAAAWWRGGAVALIIVAVGLQKAVESASDLFFGLFQREEKLKWMGQSVVLRSTLASIAFVGVMLVYGNLLAACVAGLAIRVVVFVMHDLARGAQLTHWRADGINGAGNARVKKLLVASLPLAAGLFLMSLAVNIPRYFVEKRIGLAALGVFAALVYLFQAGAMLIDAVGQASCVRLARFHFLGDRRAFRDLLLKLCGLAALGAFGGIAVACVGGGTLLRLAYSAAFAGAAKPFVWLSVCAVPWYCSSILGYALIARRQMTALFHCQVVSLAATLGASYWLIGGHSLSNACGVVFVTYSVLLVLYGFVLWSEPEEGVTA